MRNTHTLLGIIVGLVLMLAAAAPAMANPPFQVRGAAAVLGDVDSGAVMFEQDPDMRLEPASLTKVMTLYLVYEALANGDLKLDETLPVSERAWRMGGSKTFVKVGDWVRVEDLIQGIAVQSGNDACVVVAEHIGGSVEGFADMMNQKARQLGMTGTHFMNPTGLPHEDHYSTARDLFLLARALLRNFPQYGHFVQEKQYTFNGIRQHNRNRLLWRDPSITGLKTGHTKAAGYCLIASNEKDGQRLVAVVLGAKSSKVREEEALRLLRYGNRTFETVRLYDAGQEVRQLRVWKGAVEQVGSQVQQSIIVTVPRKSRGQLEVGLTYEEPILAPLAEGQQLGTLVVRLGEQELLTRPVVASQAVAEGGMLSGLVDSVRLQLGW